MLLECTACEAIVDATVLHQYTISDEFAPTFRVTLAKCPRCSAPMLAQQMESFFENSWDHPERLYPAPEDSLSASVPALIRDSFDEARTCLKARAYTAAAVMFRRTLEGICAEHGHRERTLAMSLRGMRDAGIVEGRLYDWAEELRHSGNDAAHDVNVTVSAQDAADLLEFTRALVEYLYTYRDRFEAFRSRRSGGDRSVSTDAGGAPVSEETE